MTAIDELYLVQNGVDDVVDTDHNTLVDAVLFQNDAFGGTYNYGNGRDGNLKMGAISPNATTAPTVIAGVAGSLTGTFYYKYSVYNLSGETTVSSASSAVAPSAQKVTVTIPAFANNTNVTGFYLYRSADNVTYYRVAFIPVDDATDGATYVDNLPITSGTAPQGSNTTGTSVTTGGTFYAKSVSIPTGTITLASSLPYLVILCQGDVTFGGTISGAGVWTANSIPEYTAQATNQPSSASTKGINSSIVSTYGSGSRIFLNTTQLQSSNSRWIFKQGSGGAGGVGDGKAGGTVFIAAKGALNVSTGTITLNGANGGASQADGGGAGGICVLSSSTYINRTGVTISANGGNGSTGTNGTVPGASGGGGGIVVFISDYIIGSATVSVNGGSAGAANPSAGGSSYGAVGGGCGGDGGLQISTTQTPNAGSAGISLDTTPRATSLPRLG